MAFVALTIVFLLAFWLFARWLSRRLRQQSTPVMIALSATYFLLVLQIARLTLGA